MRIASKRDTLKSFEFAALTDIVLNMFIFFFISFSLLYTFNPERLAEFDIKLPTAKNVNLPSRSDSFTVLVKSEGKIFLNDKEVSKETLKSDLEASFLKNPEIAVMLYSDRGTSFRHVVDILDIFTGIGIENLKIAATKLKE